MTLTMGWSHPLAECRGMDPELFLPQRGDATPPAAIAACARCPVRAECLACAIDHKEVGYWGGTSERKRRELRSAEMDVVTGHATSLVLEYLHRHAGKEHMVATIARAIDRSESTTRQACLRLRQKGLIRSKKGYRMGGASGGVSMRWYVPADAEVT